jgi:hypothetical protein
MRMATPDVDSTKFYNIIFEEKNGTSGIFVTKYTPTEQWLTDKEQAFEGSAKTYRVTDDITHVIDDAGGGGGSSGGIINSGASNEYPNDCDGWVETTVIYVPVPCECDPHHPPGECDTSTCSTPGFWRPEYTYECFPFDLGGDDPWDSYNPNNGSPNGGGTSSSGPSTVPDDSSITVVLGPDEECFLPEDFRIFDLDSNCELSYYETCLMNGNSQEICDCVAEGNTLVECNTDCAQLNALTDDPVIKTRLNQLRIASGNFEKGLKINKNPSNNEYVPSPIIEGSNGTNHVNIIVNAYTSAIAHTHTNSVAYKMFSAPDILKLAQMADRVQADNGTTVQLTELTHILVFNDNLVFNNNGTDKTYALRFDDAISVQTLQDIANNKRKYSLFNKDLKKLYESDYSYQTYTDETDINKQQHHLFNFLEDHNLSISLYEANFNPIGTINNWKRINKTNLEQEDCN